MTCYQFLFRSTATVTVDESMLRNIRDRAVLNNKRGGITGFLLHVGDSFVELLEGPETSILQTVDRLTQDERHTNMVVLHVAQVPVRSVPSWSMGVFSAEESIGMPKPNASLAKLLEVCCEHNWHDDRARRAIVQTLRAAA